MEGIVFDTTSFGAAASLGGLIVLGLVVAAVLFGSMSEREKRGERLHWAADPIPGTEEPEPGVETQIPKAA